MKLTFLALVFGLICSTAFAQSLGGPAYSVGSGGGGGTPGGTSGQIQYNNSGAFGGAGTNAFINANGLYGSYVVGGSYYSAFGDSLTTGVGATTTAYDFASLIAGDTGTVLSNYGVGGAQACDISVKAFTNGLSSLTGKNFYTVEAGVNDAYIKGVGTYETNVYTPCMIGMESWLAIPTNYDTYASACTAGGSWTADTLPQSGIGENSTTNGSTLTCTIKSYGGPLYLWYKVADSNGGTFTYQVDSGSSVALNAYTTPSISTQNSGTVGWVGQRITGVSSGSHTLLITVTSATSGSNVVDIWGLGTVPPNTYLSQTSVIVPGVPREQNDALSAATAAYDVDALASANLLKSDGLPVFAAPVRPFLDPLCPNATSTCMYNTWHPNNTGYEYLREAMESAVQIQRSAVPTTTVSGTVYINSNTGNLFGPPATTALYPGYLIGSYSGYNMGMDPGPVSYSGSSYYEATKIFGPSVSIGNMNTTSPTGPTSFTPTLNVVSSAANSVGIGTTYPYSKLDISGNLSVGATASYFAVAAPSNGAIIQGSVGIGTNSPRNSAALDVNGSINIGSSTLLTSSTTLTNGAGSSAGTLTNAPAVGNPTKWIPINDNGTTRYIPAW